MVRTPPQQNTSRRRKKRPKAARASYQAERVEALLLAKRFDQLGALQLDRDVRALAKRLSELTSRSVRERIARLTQMSALLNLETEAEAVELWAAGGWKLSAAEAKQVLLLRVDLRAEAVKALPLRDARP